METTQNTPKKRTPTTTTTTPTAAPAANNGTQHTEIYISNKIAARTNGDKLNLSTRSEANKISIHKL